MKKVSVIIPVYNVENYLRKCLDSLVNQTLKDIEIIVVNDGTTDNSQEIINEYVKKYPKKVVSIIQENGGQGAARNTGLLHAKGEYIGYVDSDDYVEENMYEELYKKAKEEDSDIVICGNNVVKENYELFSKEDVDKEFLLGKMAVWNKIYKKNIIVDNKIQFRSKVWYEDLDFTMKVYFSSKKISYVDKPLYNYLLREGSTMNNNNIKRNLELIEAFDSLIDYCKDKKIYNKAKDEIEFLCIYHMYIFATTRVLNTNNKYKDKIEIINKFKNYINSNFPNFKQNKYLYLLPKRRKLIYNLINSKFYCIIIALFKIKN
jgi:glycosyltransferase, group 2 family protein